MNDFQNERGATKILLVNGDAEFSRTLVQNLHSAHKEIQCELATNAEEALEKIRQHEFLVVLADSTLPDQSGLELTQEIRKEFITKPEVVLLTPDNRVNLYQIHQAGASYFLPKPVDIEQLSTIIRRVTAPTRRSFERININSTALGHLFGKVSLMGHKEKIDIEVSNLGRGGFFFKMSKGHPFPRVGQVIDFKLTLAMVPDSHFSGRGIVRWQKPDEDGQPGGAGVEFITLPEECERLVFAFVDLFKVRSFVPDDS